MIHHEVLGFSVSVALDRDDNAGGLALDLAGVLLDEPVCAVIAGELELLVLMQRAGVEHESSHILGALQHALQRCALPDVVGQARPANVTRKPGRRRLAMSARLRANNTINPSATGTSSAIVPRRTTCQAVRK